MTIMNSKLPRVRLSNNKKPYLTIFAEVWGCDLEAISAPETSHNSYRINFTDVNLPFDGQVNSLKLRFNGRWGNYVLQLIHMVYVARRMGVDRLYILPTEVFPLTSALEVEGLLIDSVFRAPADVDGFQLEGVFFDLQPFRQMASGLSTELRRSLAQAFVRPLLSQEIEDAKHNVSPADLVVHFRSGDIFQGVEGQGGSQVGGALYVQPPLAFYKMVTRHAMGKKLGHVIIVAENTLNPVIGAFTGWLQESDYHVTTRFNHTLNSDLAFMLSARRLVFANGTIGIALALLSNVIAEAFFFRENGTGTEQVVSFFLGNFLRKHYILDNGAYIAKGEWRNTLVQRDMMNSFPEENLNWKEYGCLVDVALNKPAKQSSISPYVGDFMFHTDREHFPWWQMDLQGVYSLEEIIVYNRRECAARAYSMQIYILSETDKWSLCHDQSNKAFGAEPNNAARIYLSGRKGRAIRIQLPAFEWLHLSGIEVLSYVVDD